VAIAWAAIVSRNKENMEDVKSEKNKEVLYIKIV
jgi:hypothetical protein